MKKSFRRLAVCLAGLLLLTGCEAMQNVFKEDLPTLWGKGISFAFIPVPSQAFQNEESICEGIAPDGIQFLITQHTAPYLWNMETQQITYLTPAGPEEEALMRLYGGIDAPVDLNMLSGQKLLEQYLSVNTGFVYGPRSESLASGFFDGNDMPVYDSNGMQWLLDADTGKLHGGKDRWYVSSYKDTWMIRGAAGTSSIILKDKKTGAETVKDHTTAAGFPPMGAAITVASFLPDGSVAVVYRDIKLDLENGEVCRLVVERPNGETEAYELGRIIFGREPSYIKSTDGQQILLGNQNSARVTQPILVHCQTKEILLVTQTGETVQLRPLADFTDSNGVVLWDNNTSLMLVIDRMSDGKTMLLQGDDGTLILLEPETEEWNYMFGSYMASSIYMFWNYSSNHYDRYVFKTGSDRIDDRSYVQLTVWDQ